MGLKKRLGLLALLSLCAVKPIQNFLEWKLYRESKNYAKEVKEIIQDYGIFHRINEKAVYMKLVFHSRR